MSNSQKISRTLYEQRFCCWCGDSVKFKNPLMALCSNCGFEQYINHKPACAVIIKKSNKILLMQRAIEPEKGKYDFPGGFMDITDESVEQCVLREINEELGIAENMVSRPKYLGSATTLYLWQGTELPVASLFFECTLISDENNLRLDKNENQHFIWVDKNDFDSVEFAWKIDKPIALAVLTGA